MPKWKTKQSMSPKEEKSLQVVARSELRNSLQKRLLSTLVSREFSRRKMTWVVGSKKKIRKTRIAVNAI